MLGQPCKIFRGANRSLEKCTQIYFRGTRPARNVSAVRFAVGEESLGETERAANEGDDVAFLSRRVRSIARDKSRDEESHSRRTSTSGEKTRRAVGSVCEIFSIRIYSPRRTSVMRPKRLAYQRLESLESVSVCGLFISFFAREDPHARENMLYDARMVPIM